MGGARTTVEPTDAWQLIINTVTTIITFLLVALLQNAQRRGEIVQQTKLNAIADALADLMEHHATGDAEGLMPDMRELRSAAGLEAHARGRVAMSRSVTLGQIGTKM